MCLLSHGFASEARGADYELSLEAWGEGTLSEDGLLAMQRPNEILRQFRSRYHRYPKSISLLLEDPHACGYDFGFTGVETAFLEKWDTLKELILPDSVTKIGVTPKLDGIFRDNATLIRGPFDSFAERFAAERGLRFRPADTILAEYEFEPAQESTRLTLVFRRNGGVLIEEKVSSPGTSAGNTFGGTFTHPLKRDFCDEQTAEQIAGQFGARLRDALLADGRLAAFLDKARTHGYYRGQN